MNPHLSGSHRRTYDAIFRHPAARNLGWRDVRSMLGALAEVAEEPNGSFKITRNGQTLVLRPSLDKNIAETEELMRIRHFLERSGAASPQAEAEGVHLLVVIDHRQARVYREIQRITGVKVREAVAEVEPATGAVVCAFASGTMVQVFQLTQSIAPDTWNKSGVTDTSGHAGTPQERPKETGAR